MLGKGAYGKVYLAKDMGTEQFQLSDDLTSLSQLDESSGKFSACKIAERAKLNTYFEKLINSECLN